MGTAGPGDDFRRWCDASRFVDRCRIRLQFSDDAAAVTGSRHGGTGQRNGGTIKQPCRRVAASAAQHIGAITQWRSTTLLSVAGRIQPNDVANFDRVGHDRLPATSTEFRLPWHQRLVASACSDFFLFLTILVSEITTDDCISFTAITCLYFLSHALIENILDALNSPISAF